MDKTIDVGNVDEAVKAFTNMLNEVNLDHPIENIHLRIVGIVRTGTHQLKATYHLEQAIGDMLLKVLKLYDRQEQAATPLQ